MSVAVVAVAQGPIDVTTATGDLCPAGKDAPLKQADAVQDLTLEWKNTDLQD